MPRIYSKYQPPIPFKNPHLITIYPSLFRSKAKIKYQRERIKTPDHDFLDLDWSYAPRKTNRLAILCHGLEGTADNHYMTNAVRLLNERNMDTCCINYRGCSGEPNRLLKSYHSGKSEDLDLVIETILKRDKHVTLTLVGFSVGGNIVLKYLGEKGDQVDDRIDLAVTYSVPVSLESCADELARPRNFIYMQNFLFKLLEKVKIKEKMFPNKISSHNFAELKNFHAYDEKFTAPLNGFRSAKHYWNEASCGKVLENIRVPSLIVNAYDDPFLGEACYPRELAEKNDYVYLDVPRYGGHLGFINWGKQFPYWHEQRMHEFINEHCPFN